MEPEIEETFRAERRLMGPSGIRAQSYCTVNVLPVAGFTAKVVAIKPCVPFVAAGLLR